MVTCDCFEDQELNKVIIIIIIIIIGRLSFYFDFRQTERQARAAASSQLKIEIKGIERLKAL